MSIDTLAPVSSFFPTRSARWVNDQCRAGRIPGAVKVGAAWFTSKARIEELLSGEKLAEGGYAARHVVLTEEDAAADLRRRGII